MIRIVNGDAEFIICCDYRATATESGGQIKCMGAIEVPDINREIAEVMEGAAPDVPTAETKYKVYVDDEKGNLAAGTKFGRHLRMGRDEPGEVTITVGESAPLRYVQPGETISEEIILNKLYDLSKPGKYTVRVQSQGDPDGSAKSNPITILVTNVQNEQRK